MTETLTHSLLLQEKGTIEEEGLGHCLLKIVVSHLGMQTKDP